MPSELMEFVPMVLLVCREALVQKQLISSRMLIIGQHDGMLYNGNYGEPDESLPDFFLALIDFPRQGLVRTSRILYSPSSAF